MAEGTVEQVLAGEATWCALHGDSFFRLLELPENSVDALVTDPPAGIEFMGQDWDSDKGGMREWIEWLACIMDRAKRAMKPGAHGLVWALPRTSHWTGMALEYAGFEVRGQIQHWFGSGFPKSLNVSKAIDAHLSTGGSGPGNIRRLAMGEDYKPHPLAGTPGYGEKGPLQSGGYGAFDRHEYPDSTDSAKQWNGWGTALKPSHEIWWLVRKPLERGLTVAENVLKWGTGALNIDATRVAHAGAADLAAHEAQVNAIKSRGGSMEGSWKNSSDLSGASDVNAAGRWTPDLVFTHDARCVRRGTTEVPANPTWDTPNRATAPSVFTGSEVSKVRHTNSTPVRGSPVGDNRKGPAHERLINGRDGEPSADKRYTDNGSTNFAPLPGARRDSTESVDVWECVDGCPVAELARQSGQSRSIAAPRGGTSPNPMSWNEERTDGDKLAGHADTGSAARYFPQFEWTELDDFRYEPKPARSEKDAGLEHFRQLTGAEATDSEEGQARLNSPRSGAGRRGGIRNNQPTVKGQELLKHFCRLVTPPKGVVLTPFLGSGSEIVAAVSEGFRGIGIELNDTVERPFYSIACARLHHIDGLSFIPRESLRAPEPPRQASLFQKESA